MDLIAVELPALRISLARKPAKLRHVRLGRGLHGEILEKTPDKLI
jgi:hypothetical protein